MYDLGMQRKIVFSEGEYYHVYNRGVEKRDIFLSDDERKRFVKLLYLSNGDKPYETRTVQNLPLSSIEVGKQKVAIAAYVLMPNHFHILVKEINEGGLSEYMEKLTTGYVMYFNKKHKRVGPLFQGRFKAEHVDTDEYLKYLFAYIHLNPVKLIEPQWKETGIRNTKKAKDYLKNYNYSSYADYIEVKRDESLILSRKEFPEYFSNMKDFEDFISDWLEYNNDDIVVEAND